jgi:hypothetical protein
MLEASHLGKKMSVTEARSAAKSSANLVKGQRMQSPGLSFQAITPPLHSATSLSSAEHPFALRLIDPFGTAQELLFEMVPGRDRLKEDSHDPDCESPEPELG